MVVMLIGIILSVAVLGTGGDRAALAETEARRMLALFRLAQEEAILGRRELAARILPDGYEFQVREDDHWLPLQGIAVLRPRRLPGDLTIRLRQDDLPVPLDDTEKPARILFTASGETIPFVLELGWAFESPRWRLRGEASGELRLDALDDGAA